ncbi:MAG: transporter substrate-binding domain-containing protein [Chloroflexota bacterium]
MKRFAIAIPMILAALVLALTGQILALPVMIPVDQAPVPTRVPPTTVPHPNTAEEDILPSESAVARIQETGVVNVGILYNAPPFGELNIRGRVSGFDADLANSMASTWGVDTNFIQVTRQPEQIAEMLNRGTIDMVIAAQVHQRELDQLIEFSQSYYVGRQAAMVLFESEISQPADLANRPVGVVIESPAAEAISRWQTRTGIPVQVQTYLTLDRAFVALAAGEVAAVIDSQYRLDRVSAQQPDLIRYLEEPIEVEPYAVGLLRQDVSMRDLVNRTLHFLTANSRMVEIMQVHFPGEAYRAISPWKNLGEDAPAPSQYVAELTFPSQYVLPRVQQGGVIRVAGLFSTIDDPSRPESERRLDALHRRMFEEIVARWGVQVEYIAGATGESALELVASGQADVAVGVEPDWAWANRVDFTNPYLLHGERLMVRVDDETVRFSDFRGGTIITPVNEETAAAQAIAFAESVNVRVEISQQRERDLAFALLSDEEIDAEAVFGDSLKLIPHVQANPESLELTRADDDTSGRWYSLSYRQDIDGAPRQMVMAVPRNDIDFRLLVEYTMQEFIKEGLLYDWLNPLMLPADIPRFEVWPGPSTYFGLNLSR